MSEKIKNRITPILIIVLISAVILAEIFVNNETLYQSLVKSSLSNVLISIVFLLIIFSLGYKKQLFQKPKLSLLAVLALLISINNFPISAFLNGRTSMDYPQVYAVYHFIHSITTGLNEELFFRGFFFLIVLEFFKDHKHKTVLAIFITSVLFGLLHFANILAMNDVLYVLQQVGYSFLLGVLWAVLFVKTKNILIPIILHGLYNFFGLYYQTLGQVVIRWDAATLVVTITLSLITVLFVFYELKKMIKGEMQ